MYLERELKYNKASDRGVRERDVGTVRPPTYTHTLSQTSSASLVSKLIGDHR